MKKRRCRDRCFPHTLPAQTARQRLTAAARRRMLNKAIAKFC